MPQRASKRVVFPAPGGPKSRVILFMEGSKNNSQDICATKFEDEELERRYLDGLRIPETSVSILLTLFFAVESPTNPRIPWLEKMPSIEKRVAMD